MLKNWDNEKTSSLSLIKEVWMAVSDLISNAA